MRHTASAVLSLTAAIAAAVAHADEAIVLEPVTVTAKGYEALVSETAASVNVIESDEIRRREARSVGDLLRGEPGVAVAVDGSVGVDPIIRGLKRDQVLVLIDGVRVNAMQPPARGSLASYVNVDLIERIEVVRGPGSVLYGAGAMGGVINIVTRGGRFTDEPDVRGWTRLGYTSVDDGFRGAVGTSLSSATQLLDLSAAWLDAGDYKTGSGERLDDSGTEQGALHLRYRASLAPGHEVQLRAQRDRRENVWYLASRRYLEEPIVPPPGAGLHQPDGLNTHYTPRQQRDLLEGRYEGELGGAWDTRLVASIYRQDLERGNYDWNRERAQDYRTSDTDFDTRGGRLQVELSPHPRHVLLAGVEAWQLKASPVSFVGFAPDFQPDFRLQLIDNGRLESRGVFLQDDIYLDDFTITLGARYDEVQGSADSALGVTAPLDKTDYNLSWSAGATWELDAGFNPYASLSEGYRSAGLLERYLTYPYSDGFNWLSNPQLEPERNLSVEVGARGRIGDTRYTVAVYESRIRDYIGGQVIAPNVKQTVNLDSARIRGAEFSVDHDLGDGLSAFAWGTWLRGDNRDPEFREPLYQMPPSELSVGLAQQSPLGWQWRGQARAVAKQDRTADRFSGGAERKTPGFTTVDAAVGYRFGPSAGLKGHELTLSVSNLFDRDYREHVNEMTAARIDPVNGVQDLRAPGRSIGLTWYAEF
ncbi:TonB-dependent receptor plug domain-containing protein [Thioalkalivibrio paradoxus]|uniref:TonB-denpendent receptor n=1 Tax=Thioalkalivibrio paradoxus ARh 1 TaxID=713585 RepID=W0DJS8_9GAMM|nr:TonB-denpendent receptor [Thioalkalivibrio paradoxus ARh 1]